MRITIECRNIRVVNTDPQRRCYYGVNASEALVWGSWYLLEYNVKPEDVERRLQFWRELNDYAISQRGESARSEFRMQEVEDVRTEQPAGCAA